MDRKVHTQCGLAWHLRYLRSIRTKVSLIPSKLSAELNFHPRLIVHKQSDYEFIEIIRSVDVMHLKDKFIKNNYAGIVLRLN